MKYLTEYRDADKAIRLAEKITAVVSQRWKIMEVCGGQTHSIIRNGIDQILPSEIEMIHGPGCPVCVTPVETIDRALAIARRPNTILCSFGDMLRVPGSRDDLLRVKGAGGDVRVIYSPLDAVNIAHNNPDKEVVLLAIGFETTAPANAMAIKIAKQQKSENFSALVSHVLVPPAIRAILESPDNCVDAILAAGHVCCVTGYHAYPKLCEQYGIPIIVAGFEPLDLLEGIFRAVNQLEAGTASVENAYARVVSEQGNRYAQDVIEEVFEVTDRKWRGIGMIPDSGWRLNDSFCDFDAAIKFGVGKVESIESTICRAGEVLRGAIKPNQCSAFGRECTPRHPLGAPMVSAEGACAAYYHNGRFVQLPSKT